MLSPASVCFVSSAVTFSRIDRFDSDGADRVFEQVFYVAVLSLEQPGIHDRDLQPPENTDSKRFHQF